MVALSSCELEYIALEYASQEAVYLSDLLSELTFPQVSSVPMYEDKYGSSPAIRYYSILVKDQTHLYEGPYSARAGCIEQDNRISCEDNKSAGGSFHQILGLPEFLRPSWTR